MKFAKVLVVALLAFSFGCASQPPRPTPVPPPPTKDWTITSTGAYDFTNYPVCSATVTKGCITGFVWGYMQGAALISLKTSPTTVCSGTTQPETCTDSANSQLGIGPVTPYIFAQGIDNNGNPVPSVTVNGPVITVNLIGVTNFGWTLK